MSIDRVENPGWPFMYCIVLEGDQVKLYDKKPGAMGANRKHHVLLSKIYGTASVSTEPSARLSNWCSARNVSGKLHTLQDVSLKTAQQR